MSFTEKMGKKLSSKYSQKFLDYAKQSTIDAFKTTLKREKSKKVEGIGDLIGNKIADAVARSHSSEIANQEKEKKSIEVPRERYIYAGKRQIIINELIIKE